VAAGTAATLLILGQASAPQLDALHPWGPDEALLHSLVHELLLEPTRKAPGWRSDLVDTLDHGDDGVVISLHRGARWHDGAPVVAADVCGTLEVLGEAGSGSPFAAGVQARVTGCEVLDERIVRITLASEVDPARALAVPLVPLHLRPIHDGDPRAPTAVGCGPYAASPLPGGGWALEARGSAPYPRLRWVPGVPAAVAADLVARKEALASTSVAPGSVAGLRQAAVPLLPWDRRLGWAIAFDSATAPWDDQALRRAVDVLVDRRVLSRVVAGSDTAPAWPALSGPFAEGSSGSNRAVRPTERDVAAGWTLLEGAGYRRGLARQWEGEGGEPLVLRLGVPDGMGFPASGIAQAFVGTGLDVAIVPIDRHAWVHGALGGGQQGHLDALLIPRDLHHHGDPAPWFLPRDEGGWLAPFDAALPPDLVVIARGAEDDDQAARELHGALHDEATWLFLFEERRLSAWSHRHRPWWTSPSGWGRIDAWGAAEPWEPISEAATE